MNEHNFQMNMLAQRLGHYTEVKANEPMGEHTSMKTGGSADLFIEPESEAALVRCVARISDMGGSYYLLGNGSNVIFRDGGYRGVVVSTLKALSSDVLISGNTLKCGAGDSLARVSKAAAVQGLSGMEGLFGIPGTIGGAILMNAGAYGDEIADVISEVRVWDLVDSNHIMLSKDDLGFGYRTSVFQKGRMDCGSGPAMTNKGSAMTEERYLILSATFTLRQGDAKEIENTMTDYQARRTDSQPLTLPSSGSFFRRPEGHYAAALIDEAGLKGKSVGGAAVSDKHAGFIVNRGGATTSDILALSNDVKQIVYEKFGILLEEEPIFIGED
ncbi:MAG: UDP-N-acetylmuramate dehydrogenase [Clostridiales Family XIII bacterium]|jgi:UDP-N-acetylmuramate dehydrogenase|nr:UDP-N-acetylmuramate dehydrogenase [Clostridiales Family XIII bacterium]